MSAEHGVAVLARARTRTARRARTVTVGLVVAVAVVLVVAIAVGARFVPPPQVLASLVGLGTPGTDLVVLRLRLPRALTAVLVGAALGAAGALFQRTLRNPLASPDIIGVGAGASAAAVVTILVLGLSGPAVSVAAVIGAAATALLVFGLARRGGLSGTRFALIGIGVGAALLSVVSYLLTAASLTTAQQTLLWLTGSLGTVTAATVVPLAAACAVLLPLAWAVAGALPRLDLGDDTAAALGLPVERARAALLSVGVLLVGAAVAAAGPIAFVALMAAPIATRLAGGSGRGRGAVVRAALVGALIVGMADLVARGLAGAATIPVGVVTGVIGAPYLLWLLASARARGAT